MSLIAFATLLVSACVAGVVGQAGLPQWMTNRVQHQVLPLTDAQSLRICQMTNTANIQRLFQPLNTPRVVGTETHKAAGQYLKNTMEEAGFTTEWDRFTDNTPYGQKTFRTLIATHNEHAPRRLVLACHYDSKLLNFEFIGATDSALPCALLLDIAQTLGPSLATSPLTDLSLQMIFFDGEEAFKEWTATDSIYGARHLAQRWQNEWYPSIDGQSRFHIPKQIDRIDVLVLLDLLGAANPQIANRQGLGAENHFRALPNTESTLRRLGCLQNVPTIFQDAPSWSLVEDDHRPFQDKGVAVLHMITTPFPHVWHTAGDNAAALDWPTIHNLASVFRVFVARYLRLSVQ